MSIYNKPLQEPDEEIEKLAHRVIGVAIEVHRSLGPGYHENAYEKAMCIEMELQSIPFQQQAPIELFYKGVSVGKGYIDLLIADKLIVELKAVRDLADLHRAQLASYLKATNLHLGLLLNFNSAILKRGMERIINPHFDPKR